MRSLPFYDTDGQWAFPKMGKTDGNSRSAVVKPICCAFYEFTRSADKLQHSQRTQGFRGNIIFGDTGVFGKEFGNAFFGRGAFRVYGNFKIQGGGQHV